MRYFAFLLLFALSGCALPTGPHIVESSALKVTVDWSHAASEVDALAMADDYCQHYGKIARLVSRRGEFELVYDCVAP